MKDTKRRFETLCLYDYRGVEEHLSAMAARGWRLEKAGNQFWKYRRAEPADVRYAVTYSDEASQFNPGPTEGQQSLEDLCAAAGWTKVSDWFQMQIFSTEDENAVPLETDEALRLENIHRSMRKNFLPTNAVILAVGLLLSALFLYTLFSNPLRLFENEAWLFSGVMFLLMALLEIYTLCHYCLWRRRSRQSVENGGPCAPIRTKRYQRLNRWMLALVNVLGVLFLLAELFSGGTRFAVFLLVYMALFGLLAFAVRRTTALLRNWGVSKRRNIAGTLLVDVVLAFAMVGGLTWAVIHFNGFSGESGGTYVYQGREWDVSPEEGFPLTFSDLTGREYEHIDRMHYNQGSFFLPESRYWETVLEEDGQTGHIDYSIWTPRLSWLRDALVEDFVEETDPPAYSGRERHYVAGDPAPWGAEAVYIQYFDGEPMDTWLLVWPGRVVSLCMDQPPTAEQKGLIQARLAPEA